MAADGFNKFGLLSHVIRHVHNRHGEWSSFVVGLLILLSADISMATDLRGTGRSRLSLELPRIFTRSPMWAGTGAHIF